MSNLLLSQRRRTIRSPQNPLDKATIVSIFPKAIREIKPTIQPGVFELAAGSEKNPTVLTVGPSSWWREVDEEMPLLEIPVSAVRIADSFVTDYCNGLLAYNPDNSSPGLFYVPGEHKVFELRTSHKALFDRAIGKQKNWYQNLVKLADILWSRTNGNPISISDDMRLAAQELNIKDKPWMRDFSTIEMTNCPACGALRNPAYPICPSCHQIVDRKLYESLGLAEVASAPVNPPNIGNSNLKR